MKVVMSITLSILLYGCSIHDVKGKRFLFEKIPASTTGLAFKNSITENDEVNLINNEYTYMGQQRLLTAISHDIKSPLKFLEMVARQFLENLKSGAGDRATSVRVAGLLQEGSYRLYLLTDNLLQYLKLYSTEGIIVTHPVHLHSLVEEKRTLFADIAASGGNEIRNQISSDLEVKSDVTLLNVILHNLLDNAVKVTKDGLIIIDGEITESNVIIQVSDTGAGMRAHLVEWCNDTQQLRSNVGVTGGLGLIIVKELVHLIGGKLEVRSQPGNGTVIQLVLPS